MTGSASVPASGTVRCAACGMDLTPTPEQLKALERWGNPLRRQPCLETESGLHVGIVKYVPAGGMYE